MDAEISKRQRKAWEWSSIEAGQFIFRKPFFEAGKWRCRKVEKATGKVQRITLKASTLREARQEFSELADKEKLISNEGKSIKKISLSTAFEEWLNAIDVNNATKSHYKRIGDLFNKFLGREKSVSDLLYNEIESLFSHQWKNRKGRTKIIYRNILRRFLSWCIKHSYCSENNAEKIEIQKKWLQEQRDGMRNTAKALEFTDAQKLLSACKDRKLITFPLKNTDRKREEEIDYLWWFVFISLRTGLRVSNVLGSEYKSGLMWKNLDLEKGIISIGKESMKNGIDFIVPIHAELLSALKHKLTSLGRIPNPNEQVIKVLRLRGGFNSALKRAGLEHYRIHDLRHTFASWLGAYCPYAIMKKLLGHSGSSVTDKYVLHQNIETLREGLNKLPWLANENSTTALLKVTSSYASSQGSVLRPPQ